MTGRWRMIAAVSSIFLLFTVIMCAAAMGIMKYSAASTSDLEQPTSGTIEGDQTTDPATANPTTPPETTPEPSPSPTPVPSKGIVAVNAAHQKEANKEKEPIGPGSEEMKMKMSWGAAGVSTGRAESELSLGVALKLQQELITRGYTVVMIRDTQEVDISEAERAEQANEEADIVVHLHGNADDNNASLKGVMAFYPSPDNQYSGELSSACQSLAKAVVDGISAETGSRSYGTIPLDNLTALNWTQIPAAHIELGYLSNAEEDQLLFTQEYQDKLAKGIADGIDSYYKEKSGES